MVHVMVFLGTWNLVIVISSIMVPLMRLNLSLMRLVMPIGVVHEYYYK
jgi:hypothetical protein